jgi:flavin-dependent dehydrogenase
MVTSVLVVGGGLSGSAAATHLARAKVAVHVLDREKSPVDKMCGEFLSIEAQHHLRALGIDCAALGAVPIDRVRMISGSTSVEARLPFTALGLSRKWLDEALLEQCALSGAIVERGVRVTEIQDQSVLSNVGARTADHLLLATGKHDVRGILRPDVMRSDYVAFKMHWKLPNAQQKALECAVELIVFEGGYAGLQLVSDQIANLCLIIRKDVLAVCGKSWSDVLGLILREPHLMQRLGSAEQLFAAPVTAANLAYGYVCDAASDAPAHIFRLGDQGAMTASLTGDGMAIALRSASLAAASIKAGRSAKDYHARLHREVASQVRRAMFLQRMTEVAILKSLGLGLLQIWPPLLSTLAGLTRLPAYQEQRREPDSL